MADMLRGKSAPLLDYDAICTFVFKDYRDFAKFMYDPASKALTPDHENFSKFVQLSSLIVRVCDKVGGH